MVARNIGLANESFDFEADLMVKFTIYDKGFTRLKYTLTVLISAGLYLHIFIGYARSYDSRKELFINPFRNVLLCHFHLRFVLTTNEFSSK